MSMRRRAMMRTPGRPPVAPGKPSPKSARRCFSRETASSLRGAGGGWEVRCPSRSSGTSSRPILYGAYGSGVLPVIAATAAHVATLLIATKHWILVEDLDLRTALQPVRLTGSDRVILRRLSISDGGSACVKVAAGSDDFRLEDSDLDDCGNEGVYVGTDPAQTSTEDIVYRPTIQRNTIVGRHGSECLEFKPGVRDGLIVENDLSGCGSGILISHWATSTYQNAHRVEGNDIHDLVSNYSAQYAGIYAKSGARILGNAIWNAPGVSGILVCDNKHQHQLFQVYGNSVLNGNAEADVEVCPGTNVDLTP